MTGRTAIVWLAALVLLAAATTACDPVPPALTVDTTAPGADHDPGDGVCEVNAGQGDCTLQAAVEEANALGRAKLNVPAGTYVGLDLTVSGNVWLNWGSPARVVLADVAITVAAGGALHAEGLWTQEEPDDTGDIPSTRLRVAGALRLKRSYLQGWGDEAAPGTPLTVLAGGTALVDESVVLGAEHAVGNEGVLIARQSSLASVFASRVATTGAGQTHLQNTLIARAAIADRWSSACTGTPPVSHGYNAAHVFGDCGLTQPTDRTYIGGVFISGSASSLPADFEGVDLIPLGTNGCEVTAVDIHGAPRGVDGNGDGVPGCDVGAVERQNGS